MKHLIQNNFEFAFYCTEPSTICCDLVTRVAYSQTTLRCGRRSTVDSPLPTPFTSCSCGRRATEISETYRFLSHGTSYTPIRDVRRPNDERNAPAESDKNATLFTETQSEVGDSDGCGDCDSCSDYDGCGDCSDCGGCGDYDGFDDSDSDSGGTAARAEEGCKRYPASTPHNARHEPR